MELKKGMLKVWVKPSKPVSRATGWANDEFVVELKAPAVEGKANVALIKFFKKLGFRAKLKSGHNSKHKVVILE